MSNELIDETKYLSNRRDFIRLLGLIYKDTNLREVVQKYGLVLVGGQALAFWHYHFFHNNPSAKDFLYSFSDDIDFFGRKIGLEFLRERLNVKITTPSDFDSTVSLGLFKVPTETFPDGVYVDIINSVGGISNKEMGKGVESIAVDGFRFPLIDPLLCLKSRVHNYFAVYKPDKEKEINRVEISVRVCREYFISLIQNGWCSKASEMAESIFEMARSIQGCDLFIKNGVDLINAIDLENENIHQLFRDVRFPKAMAHVNFCRDKRSRHLERFGGLEKNDQKPEHNAFASRMTLTPLQILELSKRDIPKGEIINGDKIVVSTRKGSGFDPDIK